MGSFKTRHLHSGGDGLMSLDYLCDGVLPRGIVPSDVDAMTEIGGRFLFFELKNWGESMSYGQLLCLSRLALVKEMTVFRVRHDRDPVEESDVEICVYDGPENNLQSPSRCCCETIKLWQWREIVRLWGERADGDQGVPSAYALLLWAKGLRHDA